MLAWIVIFLVFPLQTQNLNLLFKKHKKQHHRKSITAQSDFTDHTEDLQWPPEIVQTIASSHLSRAVFILRNSVKPMLHKTLLCNGAVKPYKVAVN